MGSAQPALWPKIGIKKHVSKGCFSRSQSPLLEAAVLDGRPGGLCHKQVRPILFHVEVALILFKLHTSGGVNCNTDAIASGDGFPVAFHLRCVSFVCQQFCMDSSQFGHIVRSGGME